MPAAFSEGGIYNNVATITKIHGKTGLSFKITVHCGYDELYRKRRHYKTYRPPATWSEQRAGREAQRVAVEFENSIRQGFRLDNRKTFAEYAAYVIDLKAHTGTKHSTIELYKHLCERINPAIGHFKLTEIRPQHLNRLYVSLAEDCIKHSADNARAKVDLGALLAERKVSRAALSRQAKLSPSTVTAACRGQTIRQASAEAIASALSIPPRDLFDYFHSEEKLAVKTILQHHRFISAVLSQAEKEMLVTYNAASRATLPKARRSKVNYFQPEEITAIVQAVESEPLKWRLITHLLLVTGCRRGEIMGLKWDRVHLDKHYLTIDNNLRYSKARGIYEETPKTGETRYISIPAETISLLREYQSEQEQLRKLNGDRWRNTGFVFTRDDGRAMHPDSITAWLAKFSKRHGLPHINPHAFRHTVASVLIANHTDVVTVARQLGHSSATTTETYYAHLIEESRVQASECIADVMLRRAIPSDTTPQPPPCPVDNQRSL